jgi:hypothetical protein
MVIIIITPLIFTKQQGVNLFFGIIQVVFNYTNIMVFPFLGEKNFLSPFYIDFGPTPNGKADGIVCEIPDAAKAT